jgi:hypothetical protein
MILLYDEMVVTELLRMLIYPLRIQAKACSINLGLTELNINWDVLLR